MPQCRNSMRRNAGSRPYLFKQKATAVTNLWHKRCGHVRRSPVVESSKEATPHKHPNSNRHRKLTEALLDTSNMLILHLLTREVSHMNAKKEPTASASSLEAQGSAPAIAMNIRNHHSLGFHTQHVTSHAGRNNTDPHLVQTITPNTPTSHCGLDMYTTKTCLAV